ncbi:MULTISPECIES: DUF4872 domain-containing protein [Streptomyces]|uniref:DUF4872 domain-containing protein n=1 Tax=Streptomyces TaxID=1883 RepID=UPI00029B289C
MLVPIADAGYTEAAALWTDIAALVGKVGESGETQPLVQAGAVLGDLSRIERQAMRALSRLEA